MEKSLQRIQFFDNANEAFKYFNYAIPVYGVDHGETKCFFNTGFYIENPLDNIITCEHRKWNLHYAESEWQWYLSGVDNVAELGKIYGAVPKIWLNICDRNGTVNSNYGYHWFDDYNYTKSQYNKVVDTLKSDKSSRRASLSVYNMSDVQVEDKDVPCTYAVNFYITENKLNMSVVMRSNDLWFGFCNDQYCFSKVLEMLHKDLKATYNDLEIGHYYHFANNLHLYKKHLK